MCLMDLTDESMGISVDFTRFHESSFDRKHGNPKINRQYITGASFVIRSSDSVIRSLRYIDFMSIKVAIVTKRD